MDSGECVVAPSTPKPPARLTAATTARQWLNASSGNSIPSMSQIGDFMVFFTPSGSSSALLVIVCIFMNSGMTLAHDSQPSQALDADPASGIVIRKADDESRRGLRDIWSAGDCWTTITAWLTAALGANQ